VLHPNLNHGVDPSPHALMVARLEARCIYLPRANACDVRHPKLEARQPVLAGRSKGSYRSLGRRTLAGILLPFLWPKQEEQEIRVASDA
jgi:hypothetical protein